MPGPTRFAASIGESVIQCISFHGLSSNQLHSQQHSCAMPLSAESKVALLRIR